MRHISLGNGDFVEGYGKSMRHHHLLICIEMRFPHHLLLHLCSEPAH